MVAPGFFFARSAKNFFFRVLFPKVIMVIVVITICSL